MRYATESRGRKYVRGYGFLSFTRNLVGSATAKKARDTLLKHGKEAATKATKGAVNKAAEATGDLVGQKIADKIVKRAMPNPVEPTIDQTKDFTPKQREEILRELALL